MKKFLFFAMAVTLTVACSKNTTTKSDKIQAPQTGVIEFSVPSIAPTKALIEKTITDLQANGFNVMALNSDKGIFANNVSATYSAPNFVLPDYFWPTQGTLSFYCVSPDSTLTNDSGNISFKIGKSTAEWAGDTDVLYAKAENVENGAIANLAFDHALSWVNSFKLTSAAPESAVVTVNSIKFSAPSYATFTINNASWSDVGAVKDYTFTTTGQTVTTAGTDISGTDYMVIPTTSCNVTVSYNVSISGVSTDYTKGATITLKGGKKHTIKANLTNDLTAIKFVVTVNAYEQEDIDADLS